MKTPWELERENELKIRMDEMAYGSDPVYAKRYQYPTKHTHNHPHCRTLDAYFLIYGSKDGLRVPDHIDHHGMAIKFISNPNLYGKDIPNLPDEITKGTWHDAYEIYKGYDPPEWIFTKRRTNG